ncbi:MAG: hypothetical protein JWQ89_3028 [Devosia sp.]|uniref:hypothetical protein n=1 Tax=Devosia sp. TaxID=1871048 RepID=UPI0026077C4F|nr:hypothetical protein [Devosia sp.]MDB5541301.1 hypothetical protein [Devosia sp.]
MQKIIALALVASSLVAFPVATPSFAVDTSIQPYCGPDAPEAYKRPGGFCEQVGSNGSLVEDKDEGCTQMVISFNLKAVGKEVQVAENCYYGPAVAS